jgi:hypothetical protein
MAERSGGRVKAPCRQSLSPAGVEPLTAVGYRRRTLTPRCCCRRRRHSFGCGQTASLNPSPRHTRVPVARRCCARCHVPLRVGSPPSVVPALPLSCGPKCTRSARDTPRRLSLACRWRRIHHGGKPMATRAHQHSRRSRRLRRVRNAVCDHWLLAPIARTLSTVLLMVVARWLHLPLPGGE